MARAPDAEQRPTIWPFGPLEFNVTPSQLRQALSNLNTERDVVFYFDSAESCLVPRALLVPDEADHLIKLTDGKHEYIIDADRVAWIRVG